MMSEMGLRFLDLSYGCVKEGEVEGEGGLVTSLPTADTCDWFVTREGKARYRAGHGRTL